MSTGLRWWHDDGQWIIIVTFKALIARKCLHKPPHISSFLWLNRWTSIFSLLYLFFLAEKISCLVDEVPSSYVFSDDKMVVTLAGAPPPRGLASKDEFVAAAGRFSPEDTVLQWRCTGGVRLTEEQCPFEPCWCIMMYGIHNYTYIYTESLHISILYIYTHCILYTYIHSNK